MKVEDSVAAAIAGGGVTGAMALALEAVRKWRSRADRRAADRMATSEDKKADAELVTGIAAAFEKQNEGFRKFTDELQEELTSLRSERKLWTIEREALRDDLKAALANVGPLKREVAKLSGEVRSLTDQLKANGLEPALVAE